MSCRVQNLSSSQIRNFVKNRINFLKTLVNQTQEETLKKFDLTTDHFEIVEVEKEEGKAAVYGFKGTSEEAVSKRASSKGASKFRKRMGAAKAALLDKIPNNVVKKEAGTFIHELAQDIMETLKAGGKDFSTVMAKATSGKYAMREQDFKALQKGVTEVYDQIMGMQEAINQKTGKKGEVKILTEQIVIDSINDIGGSIDILAVFSDNTASVFDFKSMSPSYYYKTGVGSNAKIIKEFIPSYKEESYKLQMNEYKRILRDIYGIDGFRQTRIIPVQTEFQLKPTEERAKDGSDTFTGKINKIAIGESQNEFLKQLPLGFEPTGYKKLDQLLKSQLNLVKKS
jgi:hypothetical protein